MPAFGQSIERIKLASFLTILETSESHESFATGNSAWAVAKAVVSLHSTVVSKTPGLVIQTGAVVSWTVMICVNVSETLPQASVTVHVLVYVPALIQSWLATNWPAFLTIFDTSVSQLSEATGNSAWAFAKAVVSLHSTVVFNEPTAVDQVGAVVSWTVMICVNVSETLPHASVTVQVLV